MHGRVPHQVKDCRCLRSCISLRLIEILLLTSGSLPSNGTVTSVGCIIGIARGIESRVSTSNSLSF